MQAREYVYYFGHEKDAADVLHGRWWTTIESILKKEHKLHTFNSYAETEQESEKRDRDNHVAHVIWRGGSCSFSLNRMDSAVFFFSSFASKKVPKCTTCQKKKRSEERKIYDALCLYGLGRKKIQRISKWKEKNVFWARAKLNEGIRASFSSPSTRSLSWFTHLLHWNLGTWSRMRVVRSILTGALSATRNSARVYQKTVILSMLSIFAFLPRTMTFFSLENIEIQLWLGDKIPLTCFGNWFLLSFCPMIYLCLFCLFFLPSLIYFSIAKFADKIQFSPQRHKVM